MIPFLFDTRSGRFVFLTLREALETLKVGSGKGDVISVAIIEDRSENEGGFERKPELQGISADDRAKAADLLGDCLEFPVHSVTAKALAGGNSFDFAVLDGAPMLKAYAKEEMGLRPGQGKA